jgi:uncharacterized protein
LPSFSHYHFWLEKEPAFSIPRPPQDDNHITEGADPPLAPLTPPAFCTIMKAMRTAVFVFRPDLEFFTPAHAAEVRLTFEDHQTVKHLVESLGVPHVEIGEVRQDGQPVGLGDFPGDGARMEIQPPPPGCPVEPRFVIDNHLGRLAACLRMLGFDCLYRNDFQDEEMAALLTEDPRILLSRDRLLLMRKVVCYGYCPRSLEPQAQLREVVRRFDLTKLIHPFRRCLRCNTPLVPVDKSAVLDRLEPLTKRYFDDFRLCPGCNQVYWKGSHYERMMGVIEGLRN